MPQNEPAFLREMVGTAMSADQLELMGKEAANLYDTSGISMNEAVVHAIGQTKLNAEQVRRVVEFANHKAFEKKYASLSADMRAVEIEGGPADVVQVLHDLNDGAVPVKYASGNSDYASPPTKVASDEDSLDFGLGAVSVEGQSLRGQGFVQLETLHAKLAAAIDDVSGQEGAAYMSMLDAREALQKSVRSAVKEAGVTQEELIDAWQEVNPSLVETALACTNAPPSHTKIARKLNPEHPVVEQYVQFAHHAEAFAKAKVARQALEGDLSKVDAVLYMSRTKKANTASAVGKLVGKVLGTARKGVSLGQKAMGDLGEGVAKGMGYDGKAGKALGRAVLPTIGAGAAATSDKGKEMRARHGFFVPKEYGGKW